MGTVGSVDTRNKNCEIKTSDELCCRKHTNTVTHYNEDSDQLYCLSCYQDFKRGKSNAVSSDHVQTIDGYICTVRFKQSEVKILNRLKDCHRASKVHLDQIKRSKEAVEKRKLEILNDMSQFVKRVLKLLHKAEDDIYKDTNEKVQKFTDKLNTFESEISSRFNQLKTLEEDVDKYRREKNNARRLDTFIKGKHFIDEEESINYEIPDFKSKLILNKNLTFKEILENEAAAKSNGLASIADELTEELTTISDISGALESDKYPNIEDRHKQLEVNIAKENYETKAITDMEIDSGKQTDRSRNSRRASISPPFSPKDITYPGKIASPPLPVVPPSNKQRKKPTERALRRTKEIKLPKDDNIPNITDSAILDNGSIVLCDQKNEKLILMNDAFVFINEKKVTGHPHNLAQVPNTNTKIAVTIPDGNVIKIVEVKEDTFTDEIEVIQLETKPKCFGIDYVDRYLVYTTRNDLTVVKREDLSNCKKFSYNFHSPVSVSADRKNNILYVSCLGVKSSGEVVKIDCITENVDFVISCDEIQHPVCSTYDREGNIYICNIDPPSIHHVSPDGKYFGQVLGSSEGKFQHVNYLRRDNMFLTTANDSDIVVIYEMT